jgi:hypothetical protein
LIFSKVQASRILAGKQTRTTRLGRQRWILGAVHPIQRGNYGPTIGHIRIVGMARLRLSSFTDADAQAEGYSGLPALQRHWRSIYGKWEGRLEVWDIRFVLVPRPPRNMQQTLFDKEVHQL